MGYARGMDRHDPQTHDSFTPEAESDRSAAESGESDQLPEEAPEEVVQDDDGGEARDDAEDSPGAADESDPDQATGNPG